jgi:hypothetical protein
MPSLLLSARRTEARAVDGMVVAGGKKEAGVARDARAEANPVCTTQRRGLQYMVSTDAGR